MMITSCTAPRTSAHPNKTARLFIVSRSPCLSKTFANKEQFWFAVIRYKAASLTETDNQTGNTSCSHAVWTLIRQPASLHGYPSLIGALGGASANMEAPANSLH